MLLTKQIGINDEIINTTYQITYNSERNGNAPSLCEEEINGDQNDDIITTECFLIETIGDGIITRTALKPTFALGGDSITALEISMARKKMIQM